MRKSGKTKRISPWTRYYKKHFSEMLHLPLKDKQFYLSTCDLLITGLIINYPEKWGEWNTSIVLFIWNDIYGKVVCSLFWRERESRRQGRMCHIDRRPSIFHFLNRPFRLCGQCLKIELFADVFERSRFLGCDTIKTAKRRSPRSPKFFSSIRLSTA